MSEVTLFESRVGESQGRLMPSQITPPDGDWVFTLGSAEVGLYGDFDDGDYVEAVQDIDLTSADLLRCSIHFWTPTDIPAGWAWRCALLIDSAEYVAYDGWAGKMRQITDIAVPVSDLTGVHVFSIRLKAVEL